jgi:hypothetical protein
MHSLDGTVDDWVLEFSDLVPPLHYMAGLGATQLAGFLLDRNFEIDEHSPGLFCFALHAAPASENKNTVQLLLNRGAGANAQGGQYGSALQAAACSGQNGVIRVLLDEGADINLMAGVLYGNALYTAIAADNIHGAEFLISRGAKVYLPGPELEEEFRRFEVDAWSKFLCKSEGKITTKKLVNCIHGDESSAIWVFGRLCEHRGDLLKSLYPM